MNVNDSNLDRERFVEELRNHFFTEHHADAKRMAFFNLEQGNTKTVTEYHHEIVELMHCAPEVVPDECCRVIVSSKDYALTFKLVALILEMY